MKQNQDQCQQELAMFFCFFLVIFGKQRMLLLFAANGHICICMFPPYQRQLSNGYKLAKKVHFVDRIVLRELKLSYNHEINAHKTWLQIKQHALRWDLGDVSVTVPLP